jgi:hypothetical protein
MFGDRRHRCGLLIEASCGGTGKEVIGKVWRLIETSNATLSEQCKLEMNMIVVTSPEKPFQGLVRGH